MTNAAFHNAVTLQVQGVLKRYDNVRSRTVIDNVDLEVAAGEYIAIMGESGVGKSTLLNIIAGLDVADAGTVKFNGIDLAGLSDDELTLMRRAHMGFVFQAFHLLPYLNVYRNVELPLALLRTTAVSGEGLVRDILASVGLAHRADSLPHELSGGEMQRVAIARALVHRPQLILADEPTGNLDPATAAQVLEVLRAQVKKTGAAGILVTHSPDAARTTDRIYRLTPAGLVAVS